MTARVRGLALIIVGALLIVGLPITALAQDETIVYEDPAGRFTTQMLAAWADESTEAYGVFRQDEVTLYIAAVESPAVEPGIDAAVALIFPEFGGVNVQTTQTAAPNGIWTQRVYIHLNDGSFTVALAQAVGDLTYAVIVRGPSDESLQLANPAITTALLGFTFAEAIDLTGVEPPPFDDAMIAAWEAFITDALAAYEVPGAAVALVQNGEVVYTNGFGARTLGADAEPVTSDTLFMIGSITKSMTTLLMGTQVDDGLYDWETPVTDVYRDFTLIDRGLQGQMRMRDLVNHASGLPRYDVPLFLESFTPEDLFAELVRIPVTGEYREQFGYNNFLVAAGGYIAALAAGATYGEDIDAVYRALMQTELFDPIGMPHTTLDFRSAFLSGDLAGPHTLSALRQHLIPVGSDLEQFLTGVRPAGGAFSTAEDMARYLITQLNRGVTPDGERIISERNLRETWTPQIQILPGQDYGLGWVITQYNGLARIQHDGGTAGFSALITFLPDADLGVVVLSNRALGSNFTAAVTDYAFELAYGLAHTAAEDHARAEAMLRAALTQLVSDYIPDVPVEPSDYDEYLGVYQRGVTLDFDQNDGLVLSSEVSTLTLIPTSPDFGEFVPRELPGVVVELTNEDGRPVAIVRTPLFGPESLPFVFSQIQPASETEDITEMENFEP
ncbi:MAG: beta-lactamase family protein [Chloroflexi bacterium]|nr:beta-lactamase family protein [Chloroflexota bacterium]